ncbi:MAG: glycogen synthase, partial [Akkermansiaceae bacterium]|nr:glycogen synthase [Akkermansiaceae bacterium]
LTYGSKDVEEGKVVNKTSFQRRLGLDIDPDAPLFFWPSRLDPLQKGCQLLTDLLFQIISDYSHLGLQVVAVANGPHECHFHHIIGHHGLQRKVASVDFD